jgi:uncharacterized protein (TIGR02266 family)
MTAPLRSSRAASGRRRGRVLTLERQQVEGKLMTNTLVVDNGWLAEEDPTTPKKPTVRPRVHLELEVSLASESQFFAGLNGDVSEGGVFVQTYQRFSIGDRVSLSLVLPSGSIEVLGVIQWSREPGAFAGPGFGVVLERVSPGSEARIREFCRQRPPLYHEAGHN